MLQIASVRVLPLAIPMRLKFEHAGASRNVADPILVELKAAAPFAGISGWGETLARAYVTGESPSSVVEIIGGKLSGILSGFRARNFEEAVALAEQLPFALNEQPAIAARCAVELAWLDLAGRAFRRPLRDAALVAFPELMHCAGQVSPRYSGIVVGRGSTKLKLLVRVQYAYGLRDFKIKVAVPEWQRRLRAASIALGAALTRGEASLRVDANGGWTVEQALDAVPLLESCQVAAIEQPLPASADSQLPRLAAATRIPLMPDESLVSLSDAERLIGLGAGILNIRIAKVGGLLPALRMALHAADRGCGVQLGCLVGETSILTAAGRTFVEVFPQVRYLEGAFGGWLLKQDVARRPLQFRFGGRLNAPTGFGLGIQISESKVMQARVEPQSPAPPIVC